MVCPHCLIALAGFGEDPAAIDPTSMIEQTEPALPPELVHKTVAGVGKGMAAMVIAPTLASIIGAVIGAALWKNHRVWGGVIGFVGGGIVGGAVGAAIAGKQLTDLLPSFSKAFAEQPGFQAGGMLLPGWGAQMPAPASMQAGPLMLPAGTASVPVGLPGPGAGGAVTPALVSPKPAGASTTSSSGKMVIPAGSSAAEQAAIQAQAGSQADTSAIPEGLRPQASQIPSATAVMQRIVLSSPAAVVPPRPSSPDTSAIPVASIPSVSQQLPAVSTGFRFGSGVAAGVPSKPAGSNVILGM